MSSLSLPRKRLSIERTKEIFKLALKQKPKAIEELKESLEISIFKCQRFKKLIKRQKTMFQTSCHKDVQDAAETIKVQTKREKRLRKQSIRYKGEPNKEITLRESKANQHSFFRHSIRTSDSQNHTRTIQHNQQLLRRTYADSFHCDYNANSHSLPFWKLTGRNTHQGKKRWKTETDERARENTIGDITKFSQKQHSKAVNFLIFQLQLNIQDSKRLQKKVSFSPSPTTNKSP